MRTLISSLLLLALAGCQAAPVLLAPGATAPPPSVSADGAGARPTPEPARDRFVADVLEVRDAGYLYLRLRRDDGREVWAVSLPKDVRAGQRVDVRVFGEKHAFASRRLQRTFDTLLFALVTTAG